MGKSRLITSSRKKQHVPTVVVVHVKQSTGKLSSALLACLSPHTGRKRNCKRNEWEGDPQLLTLSHLPSLKVALERVYSSHNLQSVFLALSLKQKPQRPLGDFIPTIYSPSQNLQEKSDALAR